MVETIRISRNFMLSLCKSRAGTLFSVSAVSVFAFGSCKAGWYYRCLGLDPQIPCNLRP
ncbi:hypothetical protein Golax_005874 [Gossypium laxum]|uniref:Uncharacterized protein n=1 Tax=Gossypium laxum TaxID=34288 RepID=A0A7J9A218_9ROSI|nr:hypothetical protein [Gossypium laxum]